MSGPLAAETQTFHPLTISWAGESLELFAEKALWWAKESTLFIADLHIGKAATFRLTGIPVPETAHDDDLARLSKLLRQTGASRLVILGDLFHARQGQTDYTSNALQAWRDSFADLEVVLVEGNHDRRSGSPAESLRMHEVKGPWQLAPFTCFHEPPASFKAFALAGHWHPKFNLSARGESVTAACFYQTASLMVLPAFGHFTGGHPVKPKTGDRVYLTGPREVIALPVFR